MLASFLALILVIILTVLITIAVVRFTSGEGNHKNALEKIAEFLNILEIVHIVKLILN